MNWITPYTIAGIICAGYIYGLLDSEKDNGPLEGASVSTVLLAYVVIGAASVVGWPFIVGYIISKRT